MIYPTKRAVIALVAGAPVALASGLLHPLGWITGPLWIAAICALLVIDAALGGSRQAARLDAITPPQVPVGRPGQLGLSLRWARGRPARRVEAQLSADARLGVATSAVSASVAEQGAELLFDFLPTRRGPADIRELWVRWCGPLQLVWKQKVFDLGAAASVLTDVQGVREQALRLFARDSLFGSKPQHFTGEGSEFHALLEFRPGMDSRAIDWKQSARHLTLLAKEFRTERNHQVIAAIDCGRAGAEPVGGVPRVDRFIVAALLLAYACLRSGDRAGLFAFDSRPRMSTGAMAGVRAFPTLQSLAGRIDYSANETNYTLALTTLAGELKRRSLVVIFTDFTDATAARMMLESLRPVLDRHVVLFVVLKDQELEEMVNARPETPEDVSRAIAAAALLKERDIVAERLRRLGAHIVDAPSDRIGAALIDAYADLKRRDLL